MATLNLTDRILTLTDDTGTSSVDLSEIKGDIGVRGPQGAAGADSGASDVDLSNYYTKEEIAALLPSGDVDLSGYYTKAEIDAMLPPSAEGVKY